MTAETLPTNLTEVVAAAIHDHDGRLLLAQRADDGSAEAGLWEFPGGKVEPGESPLQALLRELDEELDLPVSAAQAVPGARCVDLGRRLAISLLRVQIGQQRPQCRIHQALRWAAPEQCIQLPLGTLDRQLAKWAAAPSSYHISTADGAAALPDPPLSERAWILARWPGRDDHDALLKQLLARTGSSPHTDLPIMLHDRLAADAERRIIGTHLSSQMAARYRSRPVPLSQWLAVSCHNETELDRASKLDADFVVLGAVQPTASHPDQAPLGWTRFEQLARQARLPVLALGGVRPADLAQARRHGAAGVAGISAFWVSGTGPAKE